MIPYLLNGTYVNLNVSLPIWVTSPKDITVSKNVENDYFLKLKKLILFKFILKYNI